MNDLGRADEAVPSPTRYSGTRSSTSKLSQGKSGERNATPRTAPGSAPGSATLKRSQIRSPDEVKKTKRSDTHRQPSCVTLPPPRQSPAPSNSMILLPPPPSRLAGCKIIGSDGDLSMVVSREVVEQVNRSIVRMNEEQPNEPVRVTQADKDQWNKVMCCVAMTAEVY